MKLQAHTNKLETNVEAETQDFTIGDASVIIDILRNRLYENKVQTLVQEYICNARDAMREANRDNAFEITVPTRLGPIFKVRDFGLGITPDRMANIFIKYGSSTKRSTNNQTGGFGIGAKSCWSYSDSFSIVTFIDGTKRSYVAHIGSNNQGRLDLVSTDKTSELNGTEIQIAVKSGDTEEFRDAIFRAIYFWEKKPKLKGELSSPILVSGHKIGDTEIIRGDSMPEYARINSYNNEMLAVIDGIPYAITQKLIQKVPNLQKLADMIKREVILHFGNGVVEVSASRESIADSKRTIDALTKLAGKALLEVSSHISDTFAKVTDTTGYLNTYAKMSEHFEVDKFAKFGEYSIDAGWIESPLLKKVRITSISCLNNRGRRIEKITKNDLSETRRMIKVEHLNDLFHVTITENTIQQNKRIREYLKTHNQMFIVEPIVTVVYNDPVPLVAGVAPVPITVKSRTTDTATFDQVVGDLGVKDFQTIAYVEVPKAEREKKAKILREDTDFCYHQLSHGRYQHTTLAENTKKWLYIQTVDGGWGEYDSHQLRELSNYLEETEGLQICGVASRAAKMIKGDKNYTPFADWLAKYVPSKTDILIAKWVIAENLEIGNTLANLKNVEDDFLVDMGKEYKAISKCDSKELPHMIAGKVDQLQEVKAFKMNDASLSKLIKSDYPLLLELTHCVKWDELSFYINAKCGE